LQYHTLEMEKQVGERVTRLLESPLLLKVFQRFGIKPFRRSSVFHGLDKMLRDNEITGQRCFEIGTWNGLTAIILSQFFEEVVTVDIAHNDERHEIISFLGITNIRCIDIVDNAEKKQFANALDFDFAYLDGDHAHDTDADFAMTKRCGRVLFHECWPFQRPVWDLVQSLPHQEVVYGGSGLALWRAAS
jgi:hypothetical protein